MVPAPPRPCAKLTLRPAYNNTTANTPLVTAHPRHSKIFCIQSSAACAPHGDIHRTREVQERALQRGEGWRAGRAVANNRAGCCAVIDVKPRNGMDRKDDASAASDDTRVKQTKRMTDVTVISRR